jgi:phosphoribosylformimino-5-aminoimidazole carboxamide ribotide isomerase
MLILPAIDLRGGKCVRLSQGDFDREKVYGEDPLAVARQFEADGAEWLHLVDLDGAKTGLPANLESVRRIASETGLKIEFGGGVRTLAIAQELLSAGIERVVVGTAVVSDPALAKSIFLALGERAVAGIDSRNGQVATAGWIDTSNDDAVSVAQRVEADGARRIIFTDIGRDGMLSGPNIEQLRRVSGAVGIPVIQSGGISGIDDLHTLWELGDDRPEGVIVGRAIYEGRLDLKAAFAMFGSPPSFAH